MAVRNQLRCNSLFFYFQHNVMCLFGEGKKITKENIMLMQNTVGTDLLQDLHFLFMIVILGNLKGLIFLG